jgi:hypothetical protein
MKKPLRWLPAIVAPVLIAAGVFAIPAIADAASAPPARSAAEVLALVAKSANAHYSGTVVQTSDLGLPELPTVGPGSDSSDSAILDLLSASHTARVFVDGKDRQRLQVLDRLAERDVIHNGRDLWTYDSKRNAATHLTVDPTSAGREARRAQLPPNSPRRSSPRSRRRRESP